MTRSGTAAEGWRGAAAEIGRAGTPRGRALLGRCVIEGTRLHERALRAGARVDGVVAGRSFLATDSPRERALLEGLARQGARVHEAPDAAVERLMEGRGGGALVGLVVLPAPPDLESLVAGSAAGPATILVAAGVEDPGNLGALARTALASGASGFVSAGGGDPYHPRAVRISRGSLFRLPPAYDPEPQRVLAQLAGLGVRLCGAVARGGVPLPRLARGPEPWAIVVGGEAFGLSPVVEAALDVRVSIPMDDAVDSYSVNAAAAILLYTLGWRGQT